MIEIVAKLKDLLSRGISFIEESSETDFEYKPSTKKWSKKEILGHLIDSGINNLQRFTEIQFEKQPYKIRTYNQDELVKANNYKNANPDEILRLWVSINRRIINIIELQNENTLKLQIQFDDKKISDLGFLIKDYVDHLEHHLNQIMS